MGPLLKQIAYPAGMGMGDVKLLAVMGLLLGAPVVVALLIALLGNVLTGAYLAVRHGVKAARKTALPFGPYLALGGLIAAPFYWLAVLQPQWRVATGLLALAGFFQYASLGPTFGVVQNVVGQRQRATATAALYICLNVFALGGGPLFTGWVIDRFAQADFQSQSALTGRDAADLKDDKRAGLRVHRRTGERCPVCGDTIREISLADSAFQYCPTCQTGGKALADRRMSKLLR